MCNCEGKMSIRVFGPTLFKIISELTLGKDVMGGGESNEVLYFSEYLRTAQIFFHTRMKFCFVQYREFQALTSLGSGNFVSIDVIYPEKFCVMELGPYAQSDCEKALCLRIEKSFFNNVQRS